MYICGRIICLVRTHGAGVIGDVWRKIRGYISVGKLNFHQTLSLEGTNVKLRFFPARGNIQNQVLFESFWKNVRRRWLHLVRGKGINSFKWITALCQEHCGNTSDYWEDGISAFLYPSLSLPLNGVLDRSQWMLFPVVGDRWLGRIGSVIEIMHFYCSSSLRYTVSPSSPTPREHLCNRISRASSLSPSFLSSPSDFFSLG